MVKKMVCLAVAWLLINAMVASTARAFSDEGKQARLTEQVKKGIARLGTGPDARVEVKLHDKRKLKGYLQEVTEEYFVINEAGTGATTKVLYPQVKQVKGHNMSSGARIAIGIAITAAVLITVFMVIGRLAAGS